MSTTAAHLSRFTLHAATAAVLFATVISGSGPAPFDPEMFEGRAPTAEELRPSVEAAFQSESYAPGAVASLKLFNRAAGLTLQMFHTGPEQVTTVGNSTMEGGTARPGRGRGGRDERCARASSRTRSRPCRHRCRRGGCRPAR